jgi:Xaa-Pro aminopeptidase
MKRQCPYRGRNGRPGQLPQLMEQPDRVDSLGVGSYASRRFVGGAIMTMTKPAPSRPKAYLKARHQAVMASLDSLELDALLVTHKPDLAYLSDFTGDDSIGLFCPRAFFLITDFRYEEQAALEAGWMRRVLREDKMSDALAIAIGKSGARRIGFDANHMTVGQVRALKAALREKKLKSVALKPVENVVVNLRKVKDDHEIHLIRESAALAEEAFKAVRAQIQAGLTENHVAGLMILELRSRGAQDASFPPIVASGAASSLPHYRPSEALIRRNQPLLIDWGALHRGYCSDLTRTLLMGRVSERLRTIYKIVLEAQQAAIEFLRPGVTTMQVDRIARGLIEKAGFGKRFGHGLGHGIGLEIHELPALRKKGQDEELRPGMVVTVEPGIYLPGEGGVRIEDDVLITHSGCELLTSLPRSLESAIIA